MKARATEKNNVNINNQAPLSCNFIGRLVIINK